MADFVEVVVPPPPPLPIPPTPQNFSNTKNFKILPSINLWLRPCCTLRDWNFEKYAETFIKRFRFVSKKLFFLLPHISLIWTTKPLHYIIRNTPITTIQNLLQFCQSTNSTNYWFLNFLINTLNIAVCQSHRNNPAIIFSDICRFGLSNNNHHHSPLFPSFSV